MRGCCHELDDNYNIAVFTLIVSADPFITPLQALRLQLSTGT